MKLKTYKVYTKWIGYSEIIVDAENEQEAKDFVAMGNFDPSDEIHTGNGLGYGYDNEEIIKMEEQESDNEL
tara:strand:+ start:25 stop:237 length:213 start_codon:yes stop_codon:yes gene_type:complete